MHVRQLLVTVLTESRPLTPRLTYRQRKRLSISLIFKPFKTAILLQPLCSGSKVGMDSWLLVTSILIAVVVELVLVPSYCLASSYYDYPNDVEDSQLFEEMPLSSTDH